MATGVGMGFDLDALDKAIKNAEKSFDNLIKKGQETEKTIVNNFKNMATQGVDVFVNKLNEANTLLARLGEGKGGKKTAISKSVDDANTLLTVVNKINSQGILSEKSIQMRGTERFVELMNTINTAGKDRTGGRIKQLNEEIDEAKKKLGELQNLLNFYTKGEGKTSYAFADTSATQREAKALMARIEMLEREKEHVQANAALRSRVNDQRIAQQNEINRQYQSSLDKQSQASNNAAKAENRIYEERDKKHEERQRAYNAMGRKMNQQTMQDLAAEYEAEQRYNKQRQSNQQSQMESMRKFAEERAKLEQKQGDKSKTDEHNRLQKEWQEQLKARDAAEKTAIKAEEERYKQQEKQRIANAVATSNNLDKINEQQHRKELQRITDAAKQQQDKEKTEAELNKKRLAWVKQVDEEEKRKHQNELDRINKRFDAMRKREENQRRETQAKLNTTQGALGAYNQLYSPQGVRSLNQMKTVLKQLETAQANINRATKEGQRDWNQVGDAIKRVKRDIESTEREMGKLHSQQKGVLDTSGQLARALAAAFSVSAIRGYVNKLMQIRGEFELQQRSLQVLLQNKDEANALWDKTVALAVKSPFTTKQLVTYTKQLAAYRIESEKLYETNKMLADVSAGLGVDMNRLILAFGQVRAANFLRGTELRQFSEAGVNMLDELAKRFTALEGRAVSVGEVFERVSKRMVSFKDVEAVFKTITSKGGVFYQMQEKQSETLKGMMLNLKDSYELMLNDIGKSNEGTLKSFVSFMKLFVDGWREAAVVIKTAGTAMLFYFAASKIAKIGSAFSGLWAAMAANPVGAIAAGVGVLIGLFVSLYQHTNKLNEALLEVEKNVTESLEESIGLYRKLTDTINDSTSSLEERNEAYEELKTKFKDILPDQQLELKYIQGLSFSYKKAEHAMFAYYNAKAIQQKKDKVESLYESDFSTDTGDLVKGLKQRIEDSDKFTEEQKIKLKSGVLGAVNAVVDDLKSGKIAASIDTVKSELEKRLLDFSGVQIDIFEKDWWGEGSAISKTMKNVGELVENARGFQDAMKDISGLAYQTFAQKEATEAMAKHSKEMENAISLYKHLVSLRQKLADNKVDLTSDESTLNKKQLKDRVWYLNDLNNTLDEINKLSPGVANGIKEIDKSLVSAAEKGAYEFAKSLGTAENALYNIFADKAKTLTSDDMGAQAMLTNFAEDIKATADSKLATPLQKALMSAFDKAIDDGKLSQKGKDLLAKLLPDEKQSTGDVRKLVEALLTQYRDEVKKWENATKAGATSLPLVEYLNQFGDKKFKSAMGMYLGSDEEFNELQQKVIPVLEHIDRLLGGDPNKDKKGRSRDLVDERLRVIKEIYKAYKELNKTFDETTSKTGAMEKFGDAFYSAFGKTPEEMGYNLFTAEGVVDAYNKFISTLSKADDITKGNLAKGEFVMELQVEMQQKNDKAFQDQIEQMFSGYELSLELEKLNIPRDVAERLFGVDTFDLSEIRQKLEDELYNLQIAGGGQDQINALQKYLNRVVDMEKKAQVEMLKNYSKYLVQAQSERVKILLEQQKMLEEIASLPIGDEDKSLMRKGVEKEIQKKLQQQAWKDFQDSGMYLRLFENLEGASMQSLDIMEAKLKELRDSLTELDPTELKEINNQLEKIQELKVEKNPFKDLKEDATTFFEYLKNKKDWEKNLANSVAEEEAIKQTIDSEQLAIKEDEKQLAATQKLLGANDDMVGALDTALQVRKANLKILLDELEAQGKITKEERKRLEGGENAKASLEDRFKTAANYATGIASSLGDMTESLESVFGMSDELKDTLQVIQGVGIGLGDILNGAAGIMSGNPLEMIQGGMSAISGVAKIIGSFNEAYDKKKERQIQAEIKLVERLNKLYDQLGKQIEKAYSIDTLEAANKNAKANLEEQIRATERMIDAERDKKKTDWERIKEFNEQIQENLERLKELEQQRLQELGGIGGEDYYKDNAQTFVDAWLDGFLEIGDGLTNLEDEFDTLIMNIAKKQLMLKATDKFLAPLYMAIDEAVRDTDVTRQEMEDIEQKAKDALPQLNTFLKGLMEQMGMGDLAGSKSELGTLGAGIQGVSEETANILASYMNSIRFYVADSNTQLKALVAAQGVNADTPNPMLSQLLVIAEQTRSIRDMFESVIGRGGNNKHGGAYLKVDIG